MYKTNYAKILILSFLTILLLCLSFPPSDLGYLAWIAFVPWFLLIATEEKYIYPGSLFIGVVFMLIQASWLRHVTFIAWILLSFYCAAYFLCFTFITRCIIFKLKWPLVVIAPCVWVSLEFIRSFLLSGFPWFFIGHTQYRFLPIIQICDVTGVYGISFIIIMVNACIADLIISRSAGCNGTVLHDSFSVPADFFLEKDCRARASRIKKIFLEGVAVEKYFACLFPKKNRIFFILTRILPPVLFISILFYGFYRLKTFQPFDGPAVCLVQGNIPQDIKFESTEEDDIQILKKYTDLSMNTKGTSIDLLVWPETMMPGLLNIDPELTGRNIDRLSQQTAMQIAVNLNTHLLIGGISLILAGNEQIYFNSAYYYNNTGKLLDRYNKIHLVPFGEFTPLKKYFPFLTKLVPYEIGLTHGNKRTLFHLPYRNNKSFTFGASICYEDTVPSLIRKFRKDGVDFMLNITNDGWFRNSAELDQHLAIMVFRAVENRMGMARAANTGISSFVAPTGTIYDKLSDTKGNYREISGTLANHIKLINTHKPFYTILGDVFSFFCLTVSGILLFIAVFRGLST